MVQAAKRTRKVSKGKKASSPARTEPHAPNPNELQVSLGGKTVPQKFAELTMEGVSGNAFMVRAFSQPWMGEVGMTESCHALRDQLALIANGDMGNVEAMLYGQARALEAVFHSMLFRAASNLGNYPDAVERYMRLGLKAQSQCRTTLEALAEVKNPRSVAFVRQANIANGPQQVNNGRAGESTNPPNELREETDAVTLDNRTPPPRVGTDAGSATVVEIDRAAYARRQG